MTVPIVGASGRGIPGGGIMPVRRRRNIFSPTSALAPSWIADSENPSRLRFPVRDLALWQDTQ